MAQFKTAIPPVQKPIQELEQGRYVATDVRWGKVLDLSGVDHRTLIAYDFHGRENQQWEFRPCGSGFVINSVKNGLFLAVRDLKGLHLEGSAEVVTEEFPTCWELEVMDNGYRNAEVGAEDETGDVYVRILLPHSGLAMSFKGNYAGAHLILKKEWNDASTYWRLSRPAQQQVMKTPPISNRTTTLVTTTTVTTTTRTVTRIVGGDV